MIRLGRGYILFIEPKGEILEKEVRDHVTRKFRKLLLKARDGIRYKGWHDCACGAKSVHYDLILPDGTVTNSLAMHYLRHHRSEVPASELIKIFRICSKFGIK
jgi:hypothetical protein